MIDPGWAAVIASFVSLVLGTVGIWRSYVDSRQSAKRQRDTRRADAFIDVLRLVERRGLAVQDQIYNYTEVEDEITDDYGVSLPMRKVEMPPRNDRAEARALLAAHGTRATRTKYEDWLTAADAWDEKRDGWHWDNQANGYTRRSPDDGEPQRSAERTAREALGQAVSEALGEV